MQPATFLQAIYKLQSEFFQLASTPLQFTSFCFNQWASTPTNANLPAELIQNALNVQHTQNARYYRALQHFMATVNATGTEAFSIAPSAAPQKNTARPATQQQSTVQPKLTHAVPTSSSYFSWDNTVWSAYPEKFVSKNTETATNKSSQQLSAKVEQSTLPAQSATSDTPTSSKTRTARTSRAASRSSSRVAAASSARRTRTTSRRSVARAVAR